MTIEDKEVLYDIRQEIDEIDDQIHDLLQQRWEIAKKVKKVKPSEHYLSIRPDRESEIFARLKKRHKSDMKFQSILRMWQEILSTSVQFQSPFDVTLVMSQGHAEKNTPIHSYVKRGFGSVTKIVQVLEAQAFNRLVNNEETVIVLYPNSDLLTKLPLIKETRIFTSLPRIKFENSVVKRPPVYAIGRVPQMRTRDDRTVLLLTQLNKIVPTVDFPNVHHFRAENRVVLDVPGYLYDDPEMCEKYKVAYGAKFHNILGTYPAAIVETD